MFKELVLNPNTGYTSRGFGVNYWNTLNFTTKELFYGLELYSTGSNFV